MFPPPTVGFERHMMRGGGVKKQCHDPVFMLEGRTKNKKVAILFFDLVHVYKAWEDRKNV